MYRMLLLLCSMILTSTSWADCPELINILAKKLHPKSTLGPSEQNNCKIWPYSPDKTLVIMTLISEIPDQDPETPTYDMDVLVINNNNNEIISHFYETKAFYNDAVFTDSVIIDTARYQLNSTTRAFGVRFHKRNQSKYNNFSGEVLNLYYLKDKTLRQAVRGLSMDEAYSDWTEECLGTFKDIERILAIEKKQQNGFNNLKISEVITNSKLKTIKPDDCDKIAVNAKKQSLILKYNGNQYTVPKEYKGDGF